MSPATWSLLLFVSLGAVALGIVLILAFPHRRAGLFFGIAGAAVLSIAALQLEHAADARDWVLVTELTPLKLSPAGSAPTVRELTTGEQLTRTGPAYGDFVSVRAGATRGWVQRDATTPVVVED